MPDDRLIVALDVPNALNGLEIAQQLGDSVGFFYFDETFHLGQLGFLREVLGKRRVV